MIQRHISTLLLSLTFIWSSAQMNKADTSNASQSLEHLYNLYVASVGSALFLYNGVEYIGSYPLTNGTAFWDTAGFRPGTINYDGVLYRNVPLAYDLVSNEVAVKGYQQFSVKLDETKISAFFVGGHLFVKLGTDSTSTGLPIDFYDELYNGAIKLYAKRWKQVERAFNAADPYVFSEYTTYFILLNNRYYSVDGKKDLLQLFRDKGHLIKQFWKEKRLDFKKNKEQSIFQTVAYYIQIKE